MERVNTAARMNPIRLGASLDQAVQEKKKRKETGRRIRLSLAELLAIRINAGYSIGGYCGNPAPVPPIRSASAEARKNRVKRKPAFIDFGKMRGEARRAKKAA